MTKKKIVLVNFWGLGDLVATLYFIKKNNDFQYYIITPQDKHLVERLISSISIDTFVSICSHKNKLLLVFDLLKNIFLGKKIIFMAPLLGKSRSFAKFISYFYKNIILAERNGNIYLLNDKIKIDH